MIISGLSQHGNPLHPDPDFRARDRACGTRPSGSRSSSRSRS